MTTFPENFDTDLEIQRVDQNVSEISGDVINSLRDAVFTIQKVIGINAQGNKATFNDRVNVSMDANGLLKREALELVGLISLPVINRHIGTNAAIEETKIDLDYGTTVLKNLSDSLRVDVDGVSDGLASVTSAFNLHTHGLGNFHDGYHIKLNTGPGPGVTGMTATTVGGALNELGARLFSGNETILPHIDLSLPSGIGHVATDISVDTTNFVSIDRTSQNAQEAFDSLDVLTSASNVAHMDGFHANGILKDVNSGEVFNAGRKLLGPVVNVSYTVSTSIVKIPSVTSFAALNITTGDIIVIPGALSDSGSYQIRAVGPLVASETLGGLPTLAADELAVFHTFSETKSGLVVDVYKPAATSSEFAPLACSVRGNETIVDTISVLNPGVAKVVSLGFNGAIINSDGYDIGIRVGISATEYRNLVITDLHLERLNVNQASPVSAESVAERINAFVSDPDLGNHFPITAYRVGNELAIAHNFVGTDFTVEIVDGYTGSYPLGLDAFGADVVGREVAVNSNSLYTVNGIELGSVRTAFSGTASITSDTSTITLLSGVTVVNPLSLGIGPGSVMHVTDHPNLDTNGSYTVLSANTTSVSLFGSEIIGAPNSPTTFSVKFTDTHVPLTSLESTEVSMGLVQVLIDSAGQTQLHQRLSYGTNIGSAFEITSVTNTFPAGDVTVLVTLDNDFVNMNIIDNTISGETTRIHKDFKGAVKLFHSNGLDFVTANIIPGTIPGGVETITVNSPVPDDQALLLCTAHFNGTLSITNITDERLFGSISANQVRDDFIEVFSQKPVSDLRSNGVVRGFDVMNLVNIDAVTLMPAVPLRGGIAYINGVRVAVETQKVIIQSFDSGGAVINNVDRIIGINDFGSIQVFSDALGEILHDGYNSSASFGKILPLYRVTITNGGIGDVVDLRMFINNLDEKIDIVVDGTENAIGNFRSLEGALFYAASYPDSARLTVRVVGTVTPTNPITVPNGVSIIGASPRGGNGKNKIINSSNHNSNFITLSGNNRVENLEIVSTTTGLQGALIAVSGGNVNIEKCSLSFVGIITTNSGDLGISVTANSDVRIVNNVINNVYTGISSELGCSDLVIADNTISNVSGVGLPVGIKIGTSLLASSRIDIHNNIIGLAAVANTDLRGIFVDVGETITSLQIVGNSIKGELNIISENYLSNGIRVISASATGNKVTNLVVNDNKIENVKLHDTLVFAVYLEDVGKAVLSRNTITNVGVYDVNLVDIAYIWVDDTVDEIEINGNVLSDGESRRGIYVKNTSTLVSILNNTLKNIGLVSADYIYGLAHRANVSGNKLIGSGNYGIWWKGTYSKISNNHLGSNGVVFAFKTAILAQASYVDVENNTIVDMIDEASVGIANASSANDGIKVIGNTIVGDTMAKLVNLTGSFHIVSGNRLRNDTKSAGGETYFVHLAANTDGVTIVGNTFTGENASGAIGTAYIYSPGTVTNISITSNTMLAANASNTLTSAPIRFADIGVENCFVSGNKLPLKASYPSADNVIGPVPAYSVDNSLDNNNTIGINRGLLDTLGVHACEGMTGYHTDGTPFWAFKSTGTYWEINTSDTEARYLYLPISGLPNGSELESVEVQGKDTAQAAVVFTAQIFKRSVKASGLTVTALSAAKDLSSASAEFGNSTNIGLVPVTTGGIINHEESNYYVQIIHTKDTPTTPTDVRIYGMTITFRY